MSLNSTLLGCCSRCGQILPPDAQICPNCGRPVDQTHDIVPPPHVVAEALGPWPVDPPGEHAFTAQFGLMLQVLPSGDCLSHALPSTLLLGRGLDPDLEDALDLTALNAKAHGVSRHHCLFQRSGATLNVVDLGSTNGTYLNHVRLTPRQPFTVSDSDHLTLGTLHLIVTFAPLSTL